MTARSPREAVRAPYSGIPEPWRGLRYSMMLQCFFDNSGGADAPVFVMAGYLARQAQWEAFAEAWQRVLDLEEPRKLKRFKMVEAFLLKNRDSEFHGYSDDQRDERLKKLVRVIHDHVEHAVITAIPIEPYRRILSNKFNPDALDRPFFLAFWSVATMAARINTKLNISEKIDFVFDKEGGESKALMAAEYERYARLAPDSIKPMLPARPRFEDDETFLPLQAADMLAWLVRRCYFDISRGRAPQLDKSHQFLANLVLPAHDWMHLWNESELTQVANSMAKSVAPKS